MQVIGHISFFALYALVWITCNAKHKFGLLYQALGCAVSLESYRSKAHGGCTGVTIRLRSQSAVWHHGQCQEWSVTLDIGHMVTHTTLIILLVTS